MSHKITTTIVKNFSKSTVTLWLTLGESPQFVSSVKSVSPQFKPVSGSPRQGSMELGPNAQIQYTPPEDLGFNGNFCFGSMPTNCAPEEFPTGINLAEFNLNEQSENGFEAIDISGVAGTNAYISFSMEEGGEWTAGPAGLVSEFSNAPIGENVGRTGVYPYSCETCTAVGEPVCSSPPKGAPNPPVPQKTAICNVQRPQVEMGGIVTISFKGYTP